LAAPAASGKKELANGESLLGAIISQLFETGQVNASFGPVPPSIAHPQEGCAVGIFEIPARSWARTADAHKPPAGCIFRFLGVCPDNAGEGSLGGGHRRIGGLRPVRPLPGKRRCKTRFEGHSAVPESVEAVAMAEGFAGRTFEDYARQGLPMIRQ
jgi:hypothetical protein